MAAPHLNARASEELMSKMDFMRQLKGLDSVSDLVRLYCEEGLERDAKDIEKQVEARLAAERERMEAMVAAFSAPATPEVETTA